jgi:hypothetical protein
MAQYFLVRTLNPWLAAQGARRGDYLVDRQREHNRYALVRPLPKPGETTGWVLHGIVDGHLEQVPGMLSPEQIARRASPLRLVRE